MLKVYNSNVILQFVQPHYMLSQYIVFPLSKNWGDMSLPYPLKRGPCQHQLTKRHTELRSFEIFF